MAFSEGTCATCARLRRGSASHTEIECQLRPFDAQKFNTSYFSKICIYQYMTVSTWLQRAISASAPLLPKPCAIRATIIPHCFRSNQNTVLLFLLIPSILSKILKIFILKRETRKWCKNRPLFLLSKLLLAWTSFPVVHPDRLVHPTEINKASFSKIQLWPQMSTVNGYALRQVEI